MVYETARLAIPSNPEYTVRQLKMMLNEVESILGRMISVDEWNNLSILCEITDPLEFHSNSLHNDFIPTTP